MLQPLIILVVVLLAAILIYAAAKPSSFHVERSTSIKAPAGEDISTYQRLQRLGCLDTIQQGPRHEEKTQQKP